MGTEERPRSNKPLIINPSPINIGEPVKPHLLHSVHVQIVNPMSYPVSFTIRPGSSDRWEVVPSSVLLGARESGDVELRLKITKPLPRYRKQQFRDTFHIKSDFFDQKFVVVFRVADEDMSSEDKQQAAVPQSGVAKRSPSPPERRKVVVNKISSQAGVRTVSNDASIVGSGANRNFNQTDQDLTAKVSHLEQENVKFQETIKNLTQQVTEFQKEATLLIKLRENFQMEHPNVQELIDSVLEKERNIF